jgi:transcriptional regulator with XRE-family HTH domain
MTPPKYILGENIERERKRQHKTMQALADAAGMHSSEICRLEHGQRDPRLWTTVRIARALDLPLADLLRGIE